MDKKIETLLIDLQSVIEPYIEVFLELNDDFRSVKNYEISRKFQRISNDSIILKAMAEKLFADLEKEIPEKDRTVFDRVLYD